MNRNLSSRRGLARFLSVAVLAGAFFVNACAAAAVPTRIPGQGTPTPFVGAASTSPSSAPSAVVEAPHGFATRVVMPSVHADLPIVAGIMDPNGDPGFPLCDVAQYLPYYGQPGGVGTTYLYAHARRGMLSEMLAQSLIDAGAALLGQDVDVYTSLGWRHTYRIFIVKQHATDYSLADDMQPGQQRLIIQTSEGTVGDPLKLQVAADPISAEEVPTSDALPSAHPRDCSP